MLSEFFAGKLETSVLCHISAYLARQSRQFSSLSLVDDCWLEQQEKKVKTPQTLCSIQIYILLLNRDLYLFCDISFHSQCWLLTTKKYLMLEWVEHNKKSSKREQEEELSVDSATCDEENCKRRKFGLDFVSFSCSSQCVHNKFDWLKAEKEVEWQKKHFTSIRTPAHPLIFQIKLFNLSLFSQKSCTIVSEFDEDELTRWRTSLEIIGKKIVRKFRDENWMKKFRPYRRISITKKNVDKTFFGLLRRSGSVLWGSIKENKRTTEKFSMPRPAGDGKGNRKIKNMLHTPSSCYRHCCSFETFIYLLVKEKSGFFLLCLLLLRTLWATKFLPLNIFVFDRKFQVSTVVVVKRNHYCWM